MSYNNTSSTVKQYTADNETAYLAWFVATMFFLYQYMIRVFPNVMAKEIFSSFAITAEQFSSLGSIYSLTYGIVQLPVGVLLDRLNTKKIMSYSVLMCAVGTMMFAWAKDFYLMQIARFLIAIGSGAALGITMKIISHSLVGTKRAFFSGLTLTIGVMGPYVGAQITEFFIVLYDWRTASTVIGMSAFLIFIVGLFTVDDLSSTDVDHANSFLHRAKGAILQFKHVLNEPILIYALLTGIIYTPVCVFADLWGSVFLESKFDMTREVAVNTSLGLYIGLAVGSLILPWFSAKIGKFNIVITYSVICCAIAFCILLYSPDLNHELVYWIIFSIGFFCGAEMICFNAAWHIAPPSATALAFGLINSLSILFNSAFQQIVGILLDMMWNGKYDELGIRLYSKSDHIVAMSSIPMSLFFGAAIMILFMVRGRKIHET